MVQSLKNGGKIISCGNGGSMCDAMHFAEELTGRYRNDRPSIAALSISDPSHMSCVGNDYGYQYVFSRYLQGVGREGDVLLAISTSGNSANVLEAAKVAKEKGIIVVGLTGKDGGQLAPLCDVEVCVPWNGYADRVQEIHIKVIHSLIDYIETNI
jgi:D-sedoheptulose 7-phosphate isomerase